MNYDAKSLWLFIVLPLLLLGCATEYNLATKEEEVVVIPVEREVNMGNSLSRQVEKKFALVEDIYLQKRISDIGERIVAVCDRRDISYHFKVLNNEEANAFALPGGFVYIFSGLLKEIDSDAELAAVLAHEVGHIAARHSVKRLQKALGYDIFLIIAAQNAEDGAAAAKIGAGINELFLAYSREDEMQSDRLAARYIKKAGFAPEGMIAFLEKLRKIKHDKPIQPQYLRTHPYIDDRIRAGKEELFGVYDFKDYINKVE